MNVQDEIKELKQRITELEQQAKQEKEFPQDGDKYWSVDSEGWVYGPYEYLSGDEMDLCRSSIGNTFQTEEQAEFAAEKLKVEAELRKFSRPFKEDDYNSFIEFYMFDKTLTVDSNEYWQTQGVIYFESDKKAQQAIDTVGADRIKKYIFGLED